MHRQIAGRLTGPVTKWIVVVAALLITGVMSTFSAQLVDVQNNEASTWLPSSAESTRVLEELSETVDPNDIPTLVVYHRSSGLTEDDFAAMDEQAAEIAELDGVTEQGVLSPNAAQQLADQGQSVPPLVSEDGEVGYLYLVLNFGANGWNDIPPVADEMRDIADIEGGVVHLAGFGGQAADSAEAFEGIDTNLIMVTLLVVIVILLLTYRSPVLWLLPIICVVVAYNVATGVVYLLAKYADLTVNGQSQAILSILVIGAGTDYALLLVARYREELRRHAGPPRGDGRRAAPCRPGHPRQCRHGRGRHAVPGLRRPQLDRRPRPGQRDRHRGDLPGDGHPAARAAGVLRTLGLLAQAPRVRLPGAHHVRPLGQGRPPDQRPPARRLGGHDRPAARGLSRALQARRVRPVDRGHLHQGVRLHQGPEAARRARPGRQLQHHPGDHRQRRAGIGPGRPGRRGRPGCTHRAATGRRRPRLLRADHRRGHLLRGGVRDRRVRPRGGPRRRGRRGPRRRRVGVLPRHQGRRDPRQLGDHPDRAAGRVH